MELDKICRLCLSIKKEMRNIFTSNITQMINEISEIKVDNNNPGWPEKICIQCLHQVSRCHSFKKRIEKSDEQLRSYIKSITVVVEEPAMQRPQELRVPEVKQHLPQPQMQEIQIQRPEAHPLIIANVPTMFQNQIIGQFIQGPNNTMQLITTNPQPQPQLLQLRPEQENRCELIVQPTEMTDSHYFDEIPVVVQNANGQQTILNLPHHQVQALQQQISNNQQQQQQQQQQEIQEETDEIEIQEIQDYEDFTACEEMEEVQEEEPEQEQTYVIHTIQEESSENSDTEDKQLLAEFLAQQTISEPGRHVCNLCNQEFKHQKWLHSHMKSIHINWIKANCKKQPQCSICFKSFRGPGMLKMHMKTHEKENKLPSCTICGKEFKSKSILYRHRATHFAGQKQHRCEICDKNFSSNYQLNAHLQRHQKTHQCQHCEKSFSTSGDLKNHVNHQHSGSDKLKKASDETKSS